MMVTYTGTSGNDLFYGTSGDDTLSGGAGSDRLHGEGGNDTFIWSDGKDFYFGGDGFDIVDLSTRTSGANFSFFDGNPNGMSAYDGGGWYFGVEGFIGSAYDDSIITSNIGTTIPASGSIA